MPTSKKKRAAALRKRVTAVQSEGKKFLSDLLTLARIFAEAVLVASFIVIFLVQVFRIPSSSMHPTLQVNDRLLVAKCWYGPLVPFTDFRLLPLIKPKTGDLVVFKFPKDRDRDYIKRCIGTPGDVIELKDKALFLNGKELKEDYAKHIFTEIKPKVDGVDSRDNFGPFTVPAGSYFMMGDNRDESNDSRYWGTVPDKDIVGRAFLIIWPFKRFSVIW